MNLLLFGVVASKLIPYPPSRKRLQRMNRLAGIEKIADPKWFFTTMRKLCLQNPSLFRHVCTATFVIPQDLSGRTNRFLSLQDQNKG